MAYPPLHLESWQPARDLLHARSRIMGQLRRQMWPRRKRGRVRGG